MRPLFATTPEKAVHLVWGCQWAGSRLTVASYLMCLLEGQKVKL